MNYKIKRLDYEEISFIYRNYLVCDFPQDEVKPLSNIEKMYQTETYMAYGFFFGQEGVGKTLAGYAFCSKHLDGTMLLLDYFAILKQFRSQGIGGDFLATLKNELSDIKGILIETEDIAYASNEKEKQIRERRDAFYERNGVQKVSIHSCVFDVHYQIWQLPIKEAMDSQTCFLELKEIYKNMVPEELYIKNVNITYDSKF